MTDKPDQPGAQPPEDPKPPEPAPTVEQPPVPPQPKRPPHLTRTWIAAVVAGVLLLGGGIGGYFIGAANDRDGHPGLHDRSGPRDGFGRGFGGNFGDFRDSPWDGPRDGPWYRDGDR